MFQMPSDGVPQTRNVRKMKNMIVQFSQKRDSSITLISDLAVRRSVESHRRSSRPTIKTCWLVALILVACSPRDWQREKDKTDRQLVVGVWSGGTTNNSFGIMGYNPDGSFWTSNTWGLGPSTRGLSTTGTWNIINGQLVCTVLQAGYWNWGTRRRPQFPAVELPTKSWRLRWTMKDQTSI